MAYSVLLAEDDEQIREVITDYFSSKDGLISVETASDGNEALDLIHSKEYDLILLDVMLPGNGRIFNMSLYQVGKQRSDTFSHRKGP